MDEDRQQLLRRREIVSAYVTVLNRPADLLQACANATGDSVDVRTAVAEAFGVSDLAAEAILALQVRRFTPQALEQTRAELANIDLQLQAHGSARSKGETTLDEDDMWRLWNSLQRG